ncbi:MAG TPA: type II secretion system protein [Thermoanaerobaculia bacterium]|nr:type II secretion system protein [Thermoanaerobaculia bacterium]
MRRERGFTLIEVLAALLVLTFVITMTMWAFLERNRRLQQANELMLAYQALANESEHWRRVEFDLLAPAPTFSTPPDVLEPLQPHETTVDVRLTKPGVKNVTLTVRWKNNEREARLGIVRVKTGAKGDRFW